MLVEALVLLNVTTTAQNGLRALRRESGCAALEELESFQDRLDAARHSGEADLQGGHLQWWRLFLLSSLASLTSGAST